MPLALKAPLSRCARCSQWHTHRIPLRQEATVIAALDTKVYHEQVRLIYNQGTVLVLGALLSGLIVSAVLWSEVPRSTLGLWIGALLVTGVLRLLVIRAYFQSDDDERQAALWGPVLWVGALAAGCIWGVWPMLFYEYVRTDYLLLISTVYAGMVAVSSASGSVYLPMFTAFSMPLTIPLAISHLMSKNSALWTTGILLLMFLAVNIFLAVRGNRSSRELIVARFENQALMEKLADEKLIAERAVIAKSRFLASASHDLRQPLHAMGLFLNSLRNREQDSERLKIIDDLDASNDALKTLFNSLLDMSRLDAEIIVCNPKHFLLQDVLIPVQVSLESQAADKGITLQVDGAGVALYTDPILMERVLRNLMSNAVQYTERGSIRLWVEHAGSDVIIHLEDTGIGIPSDAIDEVFSEYFQLNNPERDRGKGLGLGLAIVQRLAKLMDMSIDVDSSENVGTRFSMTITRGDEKAIGKQRAGVGKDGRSLSRGHRVLVIDDELQVLKSMKNTLEDWGCDVLLSESARDALRQMALSEFEPDLILSDYRLRGEDNGIDTVIALRESFDREVPAIILTGDTSPEQLRRVQDSGLELMHKPIGVPELQAALVTHLGSRVDTMPVVVPPS